MTDQTNEQRPEQLPEQLSGSVYAMEPAAAAELKGPGEAQDLPPPLPPMPYAGWGSRVAAYLTDVFLESVCAMILGAVGATLAAELIKFFDLGAGASGVMIYSQTFANGSAVAWWGVAALNRMILQWYSGGTVGKQLFSLRVAELDGGDVTFLSCVKRTLLFPLSLIPFGLGLMAPLWSARKQAWHDSLARTVVLEK
jgi:uncharacterized RDD family membrane protein YckC